MTILIFQIRILQMNIFFSPPVNSLQVLSPHFQACQIVEKLLETNSVQFDLNPYDDPKDPFFLIHNRVKNLKHRLTKMIQQIESKYHEQIVNLCSQDRIKTIKEMKLSISKQKIDHLKYLDSEQQQLQEKMTKFYQFSKNYDAFLNVRDKLEQELDTLRAKLEVIRKGYILEEFVIISGVCQNKTISYLEKILFRQSKGHSIVIFKSRQRQSEIATSVFLCLINKNIYKHIGQKIARTCELNNANLYDLPNVQRNLLEYEQTLIRRLRQAEELLEMSGKQLTTVLYENVVGEGVSLKQHLLRVSYLERLIYIISHSKHIGDPPNHVLFTFYIPSNKAVPQLPAAIFPLVQQKIKHRTIMPRLQCLKQVNILTQLFSIPKHNELIPSIFMFTTVPFLFGMMFSDFGHGILLLLISLALKLSPIFYLMSFMSIYCGVIYNEFFGMKIIRWSHLGIVQPVWGVSENGLNFENSLKMKLSMIIAFVHMAFGMILKIVNEKKKHQYKKIIFDSLPKIGLLFTTVGYLVLLILKKWCIDYTGSQSTAPSIINTLLQLYLGWNPDRKTSIFGDIRAEYQIGQWLKRVSIILILIMLYNHTIRQKIEALVGSFFGRKRSVQKGYKQLEDQVNSQYQGLDFQMSEDLKTENKQAYRSLANIQSSFYIEEADQQGHSNELGPLEIFQFVLSLISSTTSYLRLFALSLAHAKLSSLLLNMLLSTLSGPHPYISIIRCVGFFVITAGMMLTLDVMQCMMHVVRLHWVEWMGKFYVGSGKLYMPQIEHSYI